MKAMKAKMPKIYIRQKYKLSFFVDKKFVFEISHLSKDRAEYLAVAILEYVANQATAYSRNGLKIPKYILIDIGRKLNLLLQFFNCSGKGDISHEITKI